MVEMVTIIVNAVISITVITITMVICVLVILKSPTAVIIGQTLQSTPPPPTLCLCVSVCLCLSLYLSPLPLFLPKKQTIRGFVLSVCL